MSIFTVAFWRAAGERSIKSAAQGAILVIAADQVNALDVAWGDVGGFALGAAILSLLTSVASDALTKGTGPSLTNAEVVTPETARIRKGEEGQTSVVTVLLVVLLVIVILALLGFLR